MQVVYKIPGGWYGNDPGTIPSLTTVGTVTVDPSKVVDALAWLRRRRAIILETSVDSTPNPGILIRYSLAPRFASGDRYGRFCGQGVVVPSATV